MTGLEFYEQRKFLTITELDTFARCPRKYFYAAGCGLRLADNTTGGMAMDFGTAIHAAIPIILSTGSLVDAMAAFTKAWGNNLGDDKRNVKTAQMILFTFANNHPVNGGLYKIMAPPKSELVAQDKISDWEIPFAINIPGLPIPLVGRIDGWCKTTLGGDIWGLEYKTTSEMSGRFTSGFKRNPQVLGYTLAMRAHGYNIKGVFVEAIGVAKTTWKNETIPVQVQDFELEEFIQWAQIKGNEILACQNMKEWPKDISACTCYPQFGQPGYMCDFDPLCSVPDWQSMKSFYKYDPHLPYILPTVKGEVIA